MIKKKLIVGLVGVILSTNVNAISVNLTDITGGYGILSFSDITMNEVYEHLEGSIAALNDITIEGSCPSGINDILSGGNIEIHGMNVNGDILAGGNVLLNVVSETNVSVHGNVSANGSIDLHAGFLGDTYYDIYGNVSVGIGNNINLHGGIYGDRYGIDEFQAEHGIDALIDTFTGVFDFPVVQNHGGNVYGEITTGNHVNINDVFDFDKAKNELKNISDYITKQDATNANIDGNKIIFTGSDDVDINYFTVNADDLNNRNIEFENYSLKDTKTIVNVYGKNVILPYSNIDGEGSSYKTIAPNILWNFVDAENVELGTFAIGTFLAPDANVQQMGLLCGNVIAGSFSSGGDHLDCYNNDFYIPTKNNSVPENSTEVMLFASTLVLFFTSKKAKIALRKK